MSNRAVATVFVIQDVNGKNLLPAREFGEICVILSGRESTDVAHLKLDTALSHMTTDDYLMLIGNPINIAIAAHLALSRLGTVRFLRWNRDNYNYIEEVVIA